MKLGGREDIGKWKKGKRKNLLKFVVKPECEVGRIVPPSSRPPNFTLVFFFRKGNVRIFGDFCPDTNASMEYIHSDKRITKMVCFNTAMGFHCRYKPSWFAVLAVWKHIDKGLVCLIMKGAWFFQPCSCVITQKLYDFVKTQGYIFFLWGCMYTGAPQALVNVYDCSRVHF